MRREVIAVILAILIVASLGSGYLAGNITRPTKTLTSTLISITTITQKLQQTTTLISVSTSTLASQETLVSSTTIEKTITSTITSTSTVLMGQPIPIASVETGIISIGGAPRTIAVNPNASRIYIADWFSNNLAVVDAASHSVIAVVTLPADNNNGIAIDYNTNMIYVLVQGGVAEVNGSTDKVVGELPLNIGAGSLAYNPSTHLIYGSSVTGNGTLIGADVTTGSIVANISLGYGTDSLAIDPYTNMIYAAGCANSFVCGSEVSVVNATSDTLVTTVQLGSSAYPRVTINPQTNVVYVSGGASLVALNGSNGGVIFNTNSLECAPFDSMSVIPSLNQVAAISLDYNYVFVYDGVSGTLVNMFSFQSTPQFVAFNPNTDELYATTSGQLLSFHNSASTGNVNSTLVGSGQSCPLP
jgi:YVTN family beta-propeller protein